MCFLYVSMKWEISRVTRSLTTVGTIMSIFLGMLTVLKEMVWIGMGEKELGVCGFDLIKLYLITDTYKLMAESLFPIKNGCVFSNFRVLLCHTRAQINLCA